MADVAEAAPAPKRSIIKTLFLLIVMIGLGGGGFFAGQFFSKDQLSPAEEVLRLIEHSAMDAKGMSDTGTASADGGDTPDMTPKEKGDEFETHYHQFPEKLTTNLKGSRRFLQVELGISTRYNEKVVENVVTHLVALKSDVLAIMSEFTEEQVTGIEGRNALAEAIRDTINARLEAEEGFGGVENVYFSNFVLQ